MFLLLKLNEYSITCLYYERNIFKNYYTRDTICIHMYKKLAIETGPGTAKAL